MPFITKKNKSVKTWAVQKGVEINKQNQSNEIKVVLLKLLDQLENVTTKKKTFLYKLINKTSKNKIKESQSLKEKLNTIDGQEYVTAFAFKAFLHADDEDKMGNTSK